MVKRLEKLTLLPGSHFPAIMINISVKWITFFRTKDDDKTVFIKQGFKSKFKIEIRRHAKMMPVYF